MGAELRRKAIQLTIFGLLFQLIYIAFRFGGAVWGAAATIAVFHDVLITLGLLVLFHYEITLNVIAALLTLVGYSVNDTIVIFDRVRENLKQRRKEPLAKVINDSINQTLSRTIISSGTTFLTVLGLYLFGGEVLRGFALHDGGRHHRGHLLDDLHREPDRGLVGQLPEAAAAGDGAGRPLAGRSAGEWPVSC